MRLPVLFKRSEPTAAATEASLKRRWVSPEDLNVSPALLGRPLASPLKRLWAVLIDLALIGLGSNLSNAFFVLAGVLGLLLWWRGVQARWAWAPVILSLVMGAWTLVQDVRAFYQEQEQGMHQRAADSKARDPAEDLSSNPEDALTESLEASASSAANDHHRQFQHLNERIHRLETQLSEARAPKSFEWKRDLEYWWQQIGHFYIWAALYFTVVPVWLKGQTVGKRLLGLRMVELTGKPFNLPLGFKRFGGYAAGFVTLNLGFAQVLWDSNRQGIQDKTAHTVVLDERGASAPQRLESTG